MNGASVTCEGDQSAGIDRTTPPSELNVLRLNGKIGPVIDKPAIRLISNGVGNAVINSGDTLQTVEIETRGANAIGIIGIAQGIPSTIPANDAFLNIPLLGINPAISGGEVRINSFSNIVTDGSGAHAIQGYSASPGYPEDTLNLLRNFTETGFSFTVTQAFDASGSAVTFSGQSIQVRGHLIDADGNIIMSNGSPVEFGTFTFHQDEHFDVLFSAAEQAQQAALPAGQTLTVAVNYTVQGDRAGNLQSDDGRLVIAFSRDAEGALVQTREAWFDTFGISGKPAAEISPTLFPDLKRYVTGLLSDAEAGGAGNSVNIVSSGTLETKGVQSHGIYAYSQGGQGTRGRDGSISHSAGAGGPGSMPGEVNVVADGKIITHLARSSGIVAVSAGGAGGSGGDGGAWRHGQKGGPGGTGGTVMVGGSAEIETSGDYSSGIIALSVGGNGGAGGSGSGAMPGGGGGFGGMGGRVIVDGNWGITTQGNWAHGIWAKSLGGNAGSGGSGGWLFGDPGQGGTATDGGKVTLRSGGEIQTSGIESYGLYAQSVGGFGGAGGSSWGLFWSFGGSGDSGGSGGEVEVSNLSGGSVRTNNLRSHGIFAQSIGGGGGSGGGEFAVFASLGGGGAAGGHGGTVTVENDGIIATGTDGVEFANKGDFSHGIFAQSIGGGGGDGGSVSGLVGIGGTGSGTSNGGVVNVTNRGSIDTYGIQSHGIFAQSIGGGGGDGGRSTGLVAIGGDAGGGGDAGIVTVVNEGSVHTRKEESHGIFAQSIGGGGGSGGSAISAGVAVAVSVGGNGGGGGDGKDVTVESNATSSIVTEGERAHAVFAQSIGGGGGNGGFAISGALGSVISVSVAIGGSAGTGGDAGNVKVLTGGSIDTYKAQSYGIFAQSIGGGGGTGGFSIAGSYGGSKGLNLGLGGTGGGGGIGANVDIGTESDPIFGSIHTRGENAHGMVAQSIGGSGGDGGFSVAGSIGGGMTANISIGGDGGTGNHAGIVSVQSIGTITTEKSNAHAILAQSIGGSGGSGGFSVSASLLGGTSLDLGFGGDGGTGSYGNTVKVGSADAAIGGTLTTHGERSHGIVAQSIGGGGGAGGASITGALLNPLALSFGFGGTGGNGGYGGLVEVYAGGNIVTYGSQSHGIVAQSIGGGGGAGGMSISGNVTAFGGLALTLGGDGGEGNYASTVKVENKGSIETWGEYAYGIMAQSIGGGGGSGGSSGAVMANFSSLIPIPEPYPTGSMNLALTLGGDGGKGGAAGRVEVTNDGLITTHQDYAYGIMAQSIGGGGGDGGKSVAATANISMPSGPSEGEPQLEVKVDFAMAIGGKGASGNIGNEVSVTNRNTVDTSGVGAHGIFAQSIGGGGGAGGDARSMILSIDPSNWNSAQPEMPDPASISLGATLSVGGKAGTGEDAGIVTIENTGSIVTRGADAFGILAQSIGGGGGIGGSGYHGLDWQDFGVPEAAGPFLDFLIPVQDEGDLHVTVGGSGGSSGNGKRVYVHSTGNVTTEGAGSIAIMAQSIGGGGGMGGIGAIGGEGEIGIGGSGGAAGNGGQVDILINGTIETSGVVAHGIFAQSIGGGGGYAGNVDLGVAEFGKSFALGAGGGNAGNGGTVTVTNIGNITTRGNGAIGIFAQSIGGGGGLGGEVGFGFGFAGSVGGTGAGGAVSVDQQGDIHTYGNTAHGIVAQSNGGISGGAYAGLGDAVTVSSAGNIVIAGTNAHGIVAQSLGSAGNGNVTVNINSGAVRGGSGSGSGIFVLDGNSNTVTNRGSVSALSGRAIVGGSGTERIDNHGTITGNIELGAGGNSLNNYSGGSINSLATIDIGTGRLFSNEGTLSPGGTGTVQTTTLTGNLAQNGTGMLALDLSLAGRASDRLNVTGNAQVGGGLRLNPIDTGYVLTGTRQSVVLFASSGVVADDLSLSTPTSSIVHYALSYPSANEVAVNTSVDFAPANLGMNGRRIGAHLNAIQTAGGSASIAPYIAGLVALPDDASLAIAYEKLGPGAFGNLTTQSMSSSLGFNDAMHSCRQREGDYRFIREGECTWARIEGSARDQHRTDLNPGYKLDTATLAGGLQREVKPDLHLGFGLAYQKSDLNSIYSDVEGERFEAGLIMKRRFGPTRISASLSTGYGRYDGRRLVDILTPGVRALAKQELYSISLHGRISHDLMTSDDGYVRPLLGLGVTHVSRNGYTETGAGGANLVVAKEHDTFVSLHPAVEFGGERKIGGEGTLLRHYLRLGVTHFLGDTDRHITASLQGAPVGVAPFTIVTKADRTYADVAVGLDVLRKSGAAVRIDFTGQYGDKSSANAIGVKFSMPF